MPFKETLEKVIVVLKVLFWVVLLATSIVAFTFTYRATNLMMDRLEAGQPPFAIGALAEPLDPNALVRDLFTEVEGFDELPIEE